MADLYQSKPGTLIKTSIAQPAMMTIDGLQMGSKMIATSFKLDRNQDVQHQKTLSQDIYSYAFGEAMGRIQVGGLLFFGDCSGVSAAAISQINSFYSKSNIFAKKGALTCTIGSGNAFQCYLESVSVVAEASPFNIGSFSLGFSVIPPSGGGKKKGLQTGQLTTGSL
jgi:hypothetical protein